MIIRVTHPDPVAETTVPIIGDPREALGLGSSLVVPISNYVYDPATGLWIRQVAGPGGTTVEFNSNRIASILSAIYDGLEELPEPSVEVPQDRVVRIPTGFDVAQSAQPDTANFAAIQLGPYNRITAQFDWTCASTATWQIDFYIRNAPGAALRNVNSFFRVAGSALGAAAGGTAGFFATTYDPIKAFELVVARTGVAGAAPGNHTMTGSVNLHYA